MGTQLIYVAIRKLIRLNLKTGGAANPMVSPTVEFRTEYWHAQGDHRNYRSPVAGGHAESTTLRAVFRFEDRSWEVA